MSHFSIKKRDLAGRQADDHGEMGPLALMPDPIRTPSHAPSMRSMKLNKAHAQPPRRGV